MLDALQLSIRITILSLSVSIGGKSQITIKNLFCVKNCVVKTCLLFGLGVTNKSCSIQTELFD
jgi:hypothetical protein